MLTEKQPDKEINLSSKKLVKWQAVVLLAAAITGSSWAIVRGESAPDPDLTTVQVPAETEVVQLPEVSTHVVSTETLDRALRVTGSLKSNEVVKISTKATGLVKKIFVEEGDRVRAGQLLVQIDDRELQEQRSRALASVQAAKANAEAAEANHRAAEAKLSQVVTGKTVKDASAESQYRQAQETLAAAESRLAQAKETAKIEATQAETRVKTARSALQSARERLKALQEGSRRQETAQAQAQVAQAQAQADKLQGMLERRERLFQEGAIASEEVENARRDYEAANAALNAAKQQLDLVREGPRSEDVRIGEEAVRQAEASLQEAEANRARRAISNEDVQAAEAQVRQARAALEASKAGLNQSAISDEEIRAARATVTQARAAVSQARAAISQAQAEVRDLDAKISQTRVYSPVNSVVTERKAHVGEAISAASGELMTLVATDSVYLEATASETMLPYLKPGAPSAVTLDAMPGRTFAGTIREIIPVSENDTRSVRLRIAVNGAGAGVIGGFARATVQGGSRTPVISIPRSALVSDQGQSAVFVYHDGKVERRPIQVGLTSGNTVEVRQGLRVGEEVVTEQASQMTDGQQVARKQ